jgi:hypothetical protein
VVSQLIKQLRQAERLRLTGIAQVRHQRQHALRNNLLRYERRDRRLRLQLRQHLSAHPAFLRDLTEQQL